MGFDSVAEELEIRQILVAQVTDAYDCGHAYELHYHHLVKLRQKIHPQISYNPKKEHVARIDVRYESNTRGQQGCRCKVQQDGRNFDVFHVNLHEDIDDYLKNLD